MNAWAVTCVSAVESEKRGKTRRLTYGGVLGGLILLFLTASASLPTADFAFFTLTSFAMAISVIETGWTGGCMLFVSTALISLAWPGWLFSWPFILVFGPYPLIRAQIDQHLPQRLAQIVRLFAGFVLSGAAALLFKQVTVLTRMERLGQWLWPALIAIGFVLVFFYDLALSLFIALYGKRLRK